MEIKTILVATTQSFHQNYRTQENSQRPPDQPVNKNFLCAFKIYIDVNYFLLISPFRFEYDKCSKRFHIVHRLFQKIFCLINFAFYLSWELSNLRKTYPKNSDNPDQILEFLNCCFGVSTFIYVLIIFWFNQDSIQELVNFVLALESKLVTERPGKYFFSKKFQTGFIC